MHRSIALKPRLQSAAPRLSKSFSTTRPALISNPFTKDRDTTLDPGKEDTDTIRQTKNPEGANPAQQHANVHGHQKPKSGADGSKEGKDGGMPSTSGGLGSNHVARGEKPGEEAVNPAVKGQK